MTSGRCLWKHDNVDEKEEQRNEETIESLMTRFSSKPPPRSLLDLFRCSLVVGQEFALTCLLLTRHRAAMQHEGDPDQWRQVAPVAVLPLILIFIFDREQTTPEKRACDALLLAGMLRLVSSVLRTLTASYSSDTVYALSIAGMVVHLLACDYRYANGQVRKKSAGVVSLNASLFSMTLLASRLSSNATVYVFVSTSVILFAFYPAARHAIAVTQQYASIGMYLVLYKHTNTLTIPMICTQNIIIVFLVINILVSSATWQFLESLQEQLLFGGMLLSICLLAPWWEYAVLQEHKIRLSGPWDIAHIVQGDGS
jgi:phosphatidylinositol glycan class C protein